MSRKDYKAIAAVLAAHKSAMSREAFDALCETLASMFKADNSNFRFDTFCEACDKCK